MSPSHSSVSELDQHLLEQATQKFFCDRFDLTRREQSAIRAILWANLASGRIARRFCGNSRERANHFLTAYVTSVASYYPQENPRLLSLQAGEPDVWRELSDWLIRCAYTKLQRSNGGVADRHAEDFAQETSLWLLEALSPPNTPAESASLGPVVGLAVGYTYDVLFSDWIAKVQAYHILDKVRLLFRHYSVPIDVDLLQDKESSESLDRALDRLMLAQEVSRLTPRQQQVIVQLYEEGRDVTGAAQQLDCTARAVYNRKYAALSHLRRRLSGQGQTPPTLLPA